MMSRILQGKKIAILVADGFEQIELTEPRDTLIKAGAAVDIVSPNKSKVQGAHHDEKGDVFEVTVPLAAADPSEYDGLVLPGGVFNPDSLRQDSRAVEFVRAMWEAGKPIAAICHGPWALIDAGVVRGRNVTSYPSLRTDLQNAGANWIDQEVVTDGGLVTSRTPDDLPAFCAKMIEEFAEGIHKGPRRMSQEQPPTGYFSQWE